MWRKILTTFLIIVLLAVLVYMIRDLFKSDKDKLATNPFEYNIEEYKKIDTAKICYTQCGKIIPHLSEICGITVDNKNRIWVSGVDTLLVFNANGNRKAAYKLASHAHCLHACTDGTLYLGMGDHVEVYDSTGTRLKHWNSLGDSAFITSIATKNNEVFIADAGNRIVWHCNNEGKILNKIGEKNPATGYKGFIIPSTYFDLAISPDEELWVVNPGMHLFENFTGEGHLRASWGKASMDLDGFSGCCNPSHFAFLPDGSVVTSEKGLVRVKLHKPSGEFGCVVAPPSLFPDDVKGLDIAVDAQQRILVLDPAQLVIHIFCRK